jgi:hypothetical protein
MSTKVKVRRAPWLAFAASVCLAGLSPNQASAQSSHSAPTGIVIPIPVSNAGASPSVSAPPRTLVRARALPKALPNAEYSSLPSSDRITDPAATGSLPDASSLGTSVPSGFASLVSQGEIKLRATAPTNCLPGNLLTVVAAVADKFGPVSVESTHRSKGRNWRAGGARHSLHLSCRAIDFRVRARARGVMAYLSSRPEVGGIKMYRNGIIHIDNGERRSW